MPFSASRTSCYLDIVTGRRKGVGAALVRAALAVPAYCLWLPVSTGARWLKLMRGQYRAPCPVMSVGNITAGGTGKTPMVEWLANHLVARGRRPAVLSRGYRATQGTANDESQMLSDHLGDVPILTGKDRAASARQALDQKRANCFILDDGFQHYAMGRDLDVVLIDCLLPFGGGHPLPLGLLREPLGALRRADVIVLTRSDQASDEQKRAIRDRLAQIDASLPVAEARHTPVDLLDPAKGEPLDLEHVRGKKALLFSGIGNPEGFERTAASLGVEMTQHFRFRDHHRYADHELLGLAREANESRCDAVLTTEKDIVKIGRCWQGDAPLLAVRVRFEITAGEETLLRLIESALTTRRI
ncbi:MAG: tetraacyldisaccharide 4'-kinase [Planctomycetes bacterium]|nr:tetraacyldisaccharide 4'-kinase [Planctomycetota bacterium]